ncbi:TonB-dependent receptor plug domain-containing protein [Erythrobacter crassostreae]|uniref:TonB-dependent receptor n=1 Tax=Erythrobacter crassostreae TaxID=2828328 RepID=A0A9X1JJI0_9SPHN|nr:TonB-dependent receptor [Erythrobacter crassostrea]MBV7257965.1 TonB-dependent receptor [Erythrobacter crassostrea]
MKRSYKTAASTSALALALSMSAQAAAQDTQVAENESTLATETTQNTIVVTGSRIERTIEESAVPIQILGAEDIEESGTTDLAEAVLQLPGVSESISPQSSNNLIQTSGLSTISLRRLGDDRTLVLINGKRAVSNSGNSDRVSLSTLPAGFVERTEVLTGGMSAVYGSDAIAGVANFILEDDFTGVQLDGRFSAPEASGGGEFRINALAGTEFAGGRGYALLGVEYRNENEVFADSSRPLTIAAIEFDDPIPSTGSDGWTNEIDAPGCFGVDTDRHCLLPSFSSSTPGGVFEGDAWFVGGQWFNDQSLRPANRPAGSDFYTDFDGWNFRPGRSNLPEREILNIALTTSFEFSDAATFSFTGAYSDVDTTYFTGFETLNSGDRLGDGTTIGNMAADHPFIPPEVEETRSGSVSYNRRLIELGEQGRVNDRRTFRLIADVTGDLSDTLRYEVFGTYGRFKQEQNNPNEYNFLNARFALDIEDDGNGGFQCVDADARADGCVPLDIFGEGTISQGAADYIRYNGYGEQVRQQYTAGGFVSGTLFDMPAGELKFAAGVEWRRESQNTDGDPDGDLFAGVNGVRDLNDGATRDTPNFAPDSDFDVTSLATFPSVSASYEVVEAYAEVDIPVFEGFNVQLAGRIGDYNTVGTIFSYNAGAVWKINDDIGLRAQYSRSQRAPNLTEIFSPPRPDADGLSDPCEGLLPDGTGLTGIVGDGAENADLAIVAANCLTEPGIQAFFADPDNAGDPFTDDQTGTQGPNAGNPNVQEETADTITAGFAFTPTFIPGLTIVGDYYRIKIKDAITSISTQNTVSLCYSADDFPNNKFCDVITRDGVGAVTEVINFQENLDTEVVSGFDAQILYRFEPEFIPGRFDIDFRYAHYFEQEVSFEGIGGETITSSPLGEIGDAEDEFRLRLGYSDGGFRLSYTVTYTGGGVDDIAQNSNPTDDRYFKVGDQDFHRIYVRYDFGNGDQFRIYGGVNNIFDDYGAFVPTGLNNGSSYNLSNSLADVLGREFYVGARVRF